MATAKPHHTLLAWKDSMTLVATVYELTARFPPQEQYGLTAQLRRSAVSIPSNVAEGAGRSSGREFANFLSISRGSLSELETQLLIAVDLGYLDAQHTVFGIVDRVSRLITGLHRKIARATKSVA